jgi:hypothetical protein
MDPNEHVIDSHLRLWNVFQPDAGFPIAFNKRLHTSLKQDFARNSKAEVWAETI